MKLEIAATGAMSRFYCPSGGRDGIDRGFTQPGDEGEDRLPSRLRALQDASVPPVSMCPGQS